MKKIYKNILINYKILRNKKYKDKKFDINSYDFFNYLFEKKKNFTEKFYKPNFLLHFFCNEKDIFFAENYAFYI